MRQATVFSTLFLLLAAAAPLSAAPDSAQFIFPPQEKHVHSSTIAALPNGDLLAAWFHGSGERTANDVVVQGARLRAGAAAWSEVFLMADTVGLPDCNPVLFLDASERLWLFWSPVHGNRWERALLKYRWSEDFLDAGPPNWQWQDLILFSLPDSFAEQLREGFRALRHPEPMWAEYALPYTRLLSEAAEDRVKRDAGWMGRTALLQLDCGRILLPLYSDGFNLSLIAYSDDGGGTWATSAPIVGLGNIQPSLVQRRDGTIMAFMRDNGVPPKRISVAESADRGETWSLARNTDLPNPGTSVAALALADGRWVMAYNDVESGRHSLAVAMSEDEGATWPWSRNLDHAAPGEGLFHYPFAIQTPDGKIHITYTHRIVADGATIKHRVIEADWIQGGG